MITCLILLYVIVLFGLMNMLRNSRNEDNNDLTIEDCEYMYNHDGINVLISNGSITKLTRKGDNA